MVKKAIVALFSLAASIGAAALEQSLVINGDGIISSTREIRFISGWSFENTALQKGWKGRNDIALGNAEYSPEYDTDLLLHFNDPTKGDETGHYMLLPSRPYLTSPNAFMGKGAASFSGPDTKISLSPGTSSLFGVDSAFHDFSIEFWINPLRANDGEVIFRWQGSLWAGKILHSQAITCSVSKSRVKWSLSKLFFDTDYSTMDIALQSAEPLVPGTWSHNLLRFESSTGLIEYLVDGKPQDIAYATSSRRESGLILFPKIGSTGLFELGSEYTGLLDELRISKAFVEKPILSRYEHILGIAHSPVIDLGMTNTETLGISIRYQAPGNSGIDFLYRSSDGFADWTEVSPEWLPFKPGSSLAGKAKGRYLQVKMALYPDGTGEIGPSISEISVSYIEDSAPSAPAKLASAAGEGRIRLKWATVSDEDLRGYLLYYGTKPGEYFGSEAAEGKSPIDAGLATEFTLTGLLDGKLYYIAVAAYDAADPPHIGDFSPETSARPSRTPR